GQPVGDSRQSTSANLSMPGVANWRQSSSWSAASTLAQKWPARLIRGQLDDVLLGANATSGGSSDNDENDWHVNPTGSSPSTAVMMAIPVAKWPRTVRK